MGSTRHYSKLVRKRTFTDDIIFASVLSIIGYVAPLIYILGMAYFNFLHISDPTFKKELFFRNGWLWPFGKKAKLEAGTL